MMAGSVTENRDEEVSLGTGWSTVKTSWRLETFENPAWWRDSYLDCGLSQKWFQRYSIVSRTPGMDLIGQGQKNISHGHNQYILDFGESSSSGRNLWTNGSDSFSSGNWLHKVGYESYIPEAFSNHLPADRQGGVCHRYILRGLSLVWKADSKIPSHILVILNHCAGGARFDGGYVVL